MSNFSNLPISHYKVLSLPQRLEANSVYYVLDKNKNIVEGYITSRDGKAIPLFNSDVDLQVVESVTGTGVTGTPTNPIVNISTFVSHQLGNLVHLSTSDGKLVVNPITSPDGSIEIDSTSTELQIQLAASIQDLINSALQPGDNVSELFNDGDGTSPYVTQADLGSITVEDATSTTKGILKLAGDLGGTADLPTTPTAIHKTGDEEKDGDLTLNNNLILPSIAAPVGTLGNLGIDDLGHVTNIPIEIATAGNVQIIATNKTGVTIPRGAVVYINGAQGSKATIDLALADPNVVTSAALGIVGANIANNASGYIIISGEATNLNTSSFLNGDKVYLSSVTPGGLTNIIPTSPNNVTFVGTVTNAHSTQGKILVNVLYTTKLDRLVDVAITSPLNNDILTHEVSSGLWKNKPNAILSRVLNINGVAQDLSTDREWRTAQADTGVLTFVGLTPNSASTINIGAVKGYIVNNETNPLLPTHTYVDYAGETNKAVTTLAGTESFVMLGVGGVISFQNTFPTSAERKAKIFLGKVSHPVGTISIVVNEPDYITSPTAFVRDLYQKFSYINENVYPYANGANLNFNLTGGVVGGNGINFVTDRTNPNNLTVSPAVATPFLYRTRIGGATGAVTVVDPTRYDVAGVPTLIGGGANNSTIQYFYLVPGQGLVVQYGQTIYSNLSTAIASVGKEPLIVYPNLVKNSILIGVLTVNRLATQLNDINQARFFKADMFGQIIGATAGTTVGTLQTGYNNSPIPQIQVTDALGAVTTKSARALDTSNIQEWQNIAGTTTGSVNGSGIFTSGSNTLGDNAPTANNHLVRKDYLDSKIPLSYSQVVYVNALTPTTATIFDLNNPPLVNDNALKANDNYLYIGSDSSTWVYKTSTLAYETRPVTNLLNQIEVSGNQTVLPFWNGKEIYFIGSGVLTIPAGLVEQFSFDLYADKCTISWAITVPHTWRTAGQTVGVAPASVTDGQFCTVSRRLNTNEFRVMGL